jgi:hypothetical protein
MGLSIMNRYNAYLATPESLRAHRRCDGWDAKAEPGLLPLGNFTIAEGFPSNRYQMSS